jgi:hypothetical protein
MEWLLVINMPDIFTAIIKSKQSETEKLPVRKNLVLKFVIENRFFFEPPPFSVFGGWLKLRAITTNVFVIILLVRHPHLSVTQHQKTAKKNSLNFVSKQVEKPFTF